jgi:hypothetical protein
MACAAGDPAAGAKGQEVAKAVPLCWRIVFLLSALRVCSNSRKIDQSHGFREPDFMHLITSILLWLFLQPSPDSLVFAPPVAWPGMDSVCPRGQEETQHGPSVHVETANEESEEEDCESHEAVPLSDEPDHDSGSLVTLLGSITPLHTSLVQDRCRSLRAPPREGIDR